MENKLPIRRQTRDKERTRRRLLDAARELFVRLGFAGTSLDAVTRRAGVNKALVRYHFGGKRGLYNAVIVEDLVAAQGRLDELISEMAPPEERLAHLIDAFGDFYAARPDVVRLITREQMEGAPNLEPKTLEALFRFFATTSGLLAEGVAAGRVQALDPHHVHLAVVGSLVFYQLTAPARESYAQRGLLPGAPLRWSDHVDVVRSILLNGLARRASGPSDEARTATRSTP